MTSNERDDRRQFPRRRLSTPIGIDTEKKKGRAGMTRDVSAGGVLFQSRGAYKLGEEVELRFRTPGAGGECRARGRVVRTWEIPERDAFFHYATAVHFHEPLGEDVSRPRTGEYRPAPMIES